MLPRSVPCSSTSTTSTRPCRDPGSGTSNASPRASWWLAAPTALTRRIAARPSMRGRQQEATDLGPAAESRKKTAKKMNRAVRKAHGRDSLQALSKLTSVVDGRRIINDDPPLLVRIPEEDELRDLIYGILESYKRTLQDDRRHLLDRYRFVDAARKVVGVGSVGTRAYIVLLEGR